MKEIVYPLALWTTHKIGPRRFFRFIKDLPDEAHYRDALAANFAHLAYKPAEVALLKTLNWPAAEALLNWASQANHHILYWDKQNYPPLLREIEAMPPFLFVEGDWRLLHATQLAMVGSRNPSPTGRENAYYFARHLSEQGLLITSGLALGIDERSHRGALDAGKPTIAVMATGIDKSYPKSHQRLNREIAEKGALVTEFTLGTAANARHFPQRNRIISGLSKGTLVIEATRRSGSLITARYAMEQNREILAIPGSIHNPLARGCHHLIRQGAKLVETSEDVLEEILGIEKFTTNPHNPEQKLADISKQYKIIIDSVGYEATSVDCISQRSSIAVNLLSVQLVELELYGLIEKVPGGYMRI